MTRTGVGERRWWCSDCNTSAAFVSTTTVSGAKSLVLLSVILTEQVDVLLLNVVPRLVNLRILEIDFSAYDGPVGCSFKKQLVRNLTKLEHLSLFNGWELNEDGGEFPDDDLMQQLAETSPELAYIGDLFLTESGFQSLASLKNLEVVNKFRIASRDQVVPMLMILLTGKSSHSLRVVSVSLTIIYPHDPDRRAIFADGVLKSELNLKLRESGLPFRISGELVHTLILMHESLFSANS